LRWPLNRSLRFGMWLAALLPLAVAVASGDSAPSAPLPGGQGEIAIQGSYIGGTWQPLADVSGAAFHFQDFMPGLGVLSGSFEGYGSETGFDAGVTFLELRGAPWMGRYWTVTGGDFHTPASLVAFPFNNIFMPEIEARGLKLEAAHAGNQYTFFVGEQTLTAGLRVAYRIVTPQTLMGFSALRRIAPHLQIGARAMQFSASREAILENPELFAPGRLVPTVRTLALQALYTPVKELKIYAEGSPPSAGTGGAIISTLAGFTWESTSFSFKTDYTREGVSYFPMAGYFLGDRQGPFAEGRWRPLPRLELYASASHYTNNLEDDLRIPLLTSFGTSAGASAALPDNFSASLTLSTLRFSQQGGGQDAVGSDNRQMDATISKAAGRQTLHLDWREIRLAQTGGPQIQHYWEGGDNVQWKHFSVGGALRYQQIVDTAQRNSLFFRGLAQANLGRFSAYGNVEAGNDLQNRTLFSTSAYRTSVIGVGCRVARGWYLQSEMFRNSLNLSLNPESIFLLENGPALAGVSPYSASLAATNQWSMYFRLSKQLHWGAGLPGENRSTAQAASLTGTVAGSVSVKSMGGSRAAAGIPVILDGARTAASGADGNYVFENVPEGRHEVSLLLAELPADLDPGGTQKISVRVEPRRSTRADLEVLPLMSAGGKVGGPEGAPLEGVVIRLEPGARYTTTRLDGSFTFYNLREGDYMITIDNSTLLEGGVPDSPANVILSLRDGSATSPIAFSFAIHTRQKPIRKVLEIKNPRS